MSILALVPFSDKNVPVAPSAPWEIVLISYLLAAVEARDARIRRLEQFNAQFAREIDRQRREGAARKAA